MQLAVDVDTADLDGYVPPEPFKGKKKFGVQRLMLLALVPLAAVLVGVLLLSARRDEVSTSAGANEGISSGEPASAFVAGPCPGPTGRSDAELRAGQKAEIAASEADRAFGWGKFRAQRPTGEWVCGWIRLENVLEDPAGYLASGGARPVYDAVEGDVIGYSYIYLGFFDKDVAESSGFDPHQLRLERYGCDPLLDKTCRS